jgi:ABC-2 type transport system permease protein
VTDSLGRIGAIAARIVRQFRRAPRTIALVFLAPVLVMTLLGYVITEKATPVALGYADLDEGVLLGGAVLRLGPLLGDLLADEGLEVRDYADAAILEKDVREADLRAGVIVPPDFTARVLAGEGFEGLRLLLEGGDPVLSADLARRFGAAVQALPRAALARFQGPAGPGVPPDVEGLADPARLTPPGQPAVEYAHGGPDLGTLSYFAPGYVAFFAFFFTFLLTSVSFLRERSSGTMERLLARR